MLDGEVLGRGSWGGGAGEGEGGECGGGGPRGCRDSTPELGGEGRGKVTGWRGERGLRRVGEGVVGKRG